MREPFPPARPFRFRGEAGLFAALLAIGLPAFSQSDTAGSWASKASLPGAIDESAAAEVGGRIYVAGGGTAQGGTKTVFAYDPAADRWQKAPDMPVALHHLQMAALGGKLYVLGGCDHARKNPDPYGVPWVGSAHAYAFDPGTGLWSRLAPLPHAAGMGGAAALGGRLYVIGGVDDQGKTLALVQEYDPATDTWRQRAPMPTPREHLGVAASDSLIYAVAGRPTGLGNVSLSAVEAYSPAGDSWQALPRLPTLRSGLAVAFAQGRLYAFGGEWPGPQRTVEEYDPARKAWRKVRDMPRARHGFPAVAWQGRIYLMGYAAETDVFTPPAFPTGLAGEGRGGRGSRARTIAPTGRNALGMRDEGRATPLFPFPAR